MEAVNEARLQSRMEAEMEGIVLAGGQSRRMNGVMKALLPVDGAAMIDRAAGAMRVLCDKVHVVVATEEQKRALDGRNLSFAVEETPGRGPLPALETGLSLIRAPLVWVSACDMPFASSKAAAYMAEALLRSGAFAAMPFIGGRLHPLQAVYRRESLAFVRQASASGELRLTALAEEMDVLRLSEEVWEQAGIDTRFVINVNRPEEYERVCRLEDEGETND